MRFFVIAAIVWAVKVGVSRLAPRSTQCYVWVKGVGDGNRARVSLAMVLLELLAR